MKIKNDKELKEAVKKAGELLQEIQNYCGDNYIKQARVRFPINFLSTADQHRKNLSFIQDNVLRTNLAYLWILSDTIFWLIIRTDIKGIAYKMLIKLEIFIAGELIDSILTGYSKNKNKVNESNSYKKRTEYLKNEGIIDNKLEGDLN